MSLSSATTKTTTFSFDIVQGGCVPYCLQLILPGVDVLQTLQSIEPNKYDIFSPETVKKTLRAHKYNYKKTNLHDAVTSTSGAYLVFGTLSCLFTGRWIKECVDNNFWGYTKETVSPHTFHCVLILDGRLHCHNLMSEDNVHFSIPAIDAIFYKMPEDISLTSRHFPSCNRQVPVPRKRTKKRRTEQKQFITQYSYLHSVGNVLSITASID